MEALLEDLFGALRALLGGPAVHRQMMPAPQDTLVADELAEPPSGCGWFDSSHELRSGLRVQELVTPEALAAALPLDSWLELELAGCGAT